MFPISAGRRIQKTPGNFRSANVPYFLPIMFLEFMSNHPEKFRSINCEILELSSKKPKTFKKKSERKKIATPSNKLNLQFPGGCPAC